jgi:hypothetical protein
VRILFVGEAGPDTGSERLGESSTGAIPILAKKVIAGRVPEDKIAYGIESGRLHRYHRATGLVRKVVGTVREANIQGLDAVVVVMDRDGEKNANRVREFKEGRDCAAREVPIPTAVGVAIETLEAWLLADEPAIGRALGLETPPAKGIDPEKLTGRSGAPDHPKTMLKKLLASDSQDRGYVEQVEAIAREADVEVVEKRCSKGFKPFADEIRQFLVPLFSSRS